MAPTVPCRLTRENCELYQTGYNAIFNQTTLLLLGKKNRSDGCLQRNSAITRSG